MQTVAARSIVTRLANAPILDRENGCGLGWDWAACLTRDVDALRAAYRVLRRAYLALPLVSEHVNGGQVGREEVDAAGYDVMIRLEVAREVQEWGGERSFDRLTVGQLFVLRAARLLQEAATTRSHLPASPETLEWDQHNPGETIYLSGPGNRAVDAALAA